MGKSTLLQLIKFLTVGSLNMLTDFAVFNTFLFFFHPSALPMFFVFSLTSSLIATTMSYFINFHWTFRPEGDPQHSKRFWRFLLFALFAITVSQSIFLFLLHLLQPWLHEGSYLLPNLAKCLGVMVGAFVNFMNYKMGVFQHEDLKHFRIHFNFSTAKEKNLWTLCGITVIAALACRLGYLLITTAIYGDAPHYADIGILLAQGQAHLIDPLWMSIFSFWEAFIYLFVEDRVVGVMIAGIIPGTLMVIPVFWIAKSLFNGQVGFLAALITAVHPRLISYSCNGYSEIFYLFFITTAVLCLVLLLKGNDNLWLAFGFGACMAVYVAVRNEGILLFLVMLPLLFFTPRRLIHFAYGLCGFGAILGLYAFASLVMLDNLGLGEKRVVLSRVYEDHLDPVESAKEIYGHKGIVYAQQQQIGWQQQAWIILKRLPRNILLAFERLPGVIISPLIFFAFVLPLTYRIRRTDWLPFTPLLMMFAFPFLFYTVVQVEPRYYFMILIPIHIFGAAGLYAALFYAEPISARRILKGITAVLVVYLLVVTIWYGCLQEKDYKPHRLLASWIKENVAPGEILAGDGLGYVSTTAFLAGHPSYPREWTEDPATLQPFMKKHSLQWLLLYEPFIKENNPTIVNIFDQGIPSMTKVYEIKDERGRRYQIFETN